MADVVCLGIVVADVITRRIDSLPQRGSLGLVEEISLHGGGCALNTASVLVRLGVTADVVGKVGVDPFGDFVLELLDERGIGRRGVVQDASVPTSATVVLVDSAGERTFLHLPGANGKLAPSELAEDTLFSGRILHVAGAQVMPELDGEPMAALLENAKARDLTTTLDTVWDATGRWERLLPSLPHVDLFAPSLAEGSAISGREAPESVAAWLRERGVGTVALKLGAEGCFVSSETFEGFVAAPEVPAVDSTGAGDAFAAGLLFGHLAGWPLERSAAFANAAGALAATAVGAVEGVQGFEETLALAGLSD
jgi:sugar/nucleoside kinase (ribokinase family)